MSKIYNKDSCVSILQVISMEKPLYLTMHISMPCIRKNGVSFTTTQQSSDIFHIFTPFFVFYHHNSVIILLVVLQCLQEEKKSNRLLKRFIEELRGDNMH